MLKISHLERTSGDCADFAESLDILRGRVTKSACTCSRNAAGKDPETNTCDCAGPNIANAPTDLLLKPASTAITGAAMPPRQYSMIPTDSLRSPARTTEPGWSRFATTLAEPDQTYRSPNLT